MTRLINHLLFFCHLGSQSICTPPPSPPPPPPLLVAELGPALGLTCEGGFQGNSSPNLSKTQTLALRGGRGAPAGAKMAGSAPRPPRPPTSAELSFLFPFQHSLVQILQTAGSHQEFKRISVVCVVRTHKIRTEHANRMCVANKSI